MTGPVAEIRAELRNVARALLAGVAAGDPLDWSAAGRAGWLGLELPEEWDGAGAGFGEVAVVAEELARVASIGPYLGAAQLASGAFTMVEPGASVASCARALAAGETTPVLVLDAQRTPLDAAQAGFALHGTGSNLRVSGEAAFVIDAPVAELLIVPVVDDAGTLALVVVDPGSPGVTIEPCPVVDATRRIGRVGLHDVEVVPDHHWHFAADQQRCTARLFDRAALGVAIDSLGIAATMLEATVGYARQRHQFDRPIGSFQAVKHACADTAVTIEMTRELCAAAVEALDATSPGTDDAEVHAAVDRAASSAKSCALEAAGTAMQLHGGIGYAWESGIHVYLKRAGLNRSLYGSPADHRRRLSSAWA